MASANVAIKKEAGHDPDAFLSPEFDSNEAKKGIF
jgi:hypothetical protein